MVAPFAIGLVISGLPTISTALRLLAKLIRCSIPLCSRLSCDFGAFIRYRFLKSTSASRASVRRFAGKLDRPRLNRYWAGGVGQIDSRGKLRPVRLSAGLRRLSRGYRTQDYCGASRVSGLAALG
jgi:hypothetical protein